MAGDIYVSFGAETGELEAAMARTKAELAALAREMRATAAEMQKSGADMESGLGQKLTDLGRRMAEAKEHSTELRASMREVGGEGAEGGVVRLKEGLESALGPMAAMRGNLMEIAEIAGVAFAAEKVGEWTREASEAAEKIERTAAMLGATTTEVQQLGAAATLTGSDADMMAFQMERLQLQLTKIKSESSPAAAALKALGVHAEEFRSLSIPQQMSELAEAFSHFADGPTKTAAAMALLGRAGAQMIPYLDRGREGLEELNKAAADTGVIMSEDDVKALAEVAEESKKFAMAVKALGQQIVLDLIGPIRSSIDWLTSLMSKFNEFQATARAQQSIAWQGLFGVPVLDPNGEILNSAIAGASGGHDVTVKKKPPVPSFDIGGRGGGGGGGRNEAAQLAKLAIDEEIRDVEEAARDKLAVYNDDLAHHRMTTQAWLAQSQSALREEAADVRRLYDQEKAIAGLSAVEIMRIEDQKKNQLRKIDREIADDARKAADQEQQAWSNGLASFVGVFNSQLRAIVSGSESWKDAMVKIFEDFAMKAIEKIEQIIVEEAALKLVSMGVGLPIPGFAVGAWNLPSDTLAMVHKGEMIVPAGPAGTLRQALSSGAAPAGGGVAIHPTTNVNIVSMDSATVASTLRANDGALVKAIDRAVRSGAALGLRSRLR